MSLCDPDELALFIQTGTVSQPFTEEAASPHQIIDATIVEEDATGNAPEDEEARATDPESVTQ
jgi:hypothetical protein